MLLKTEETIRGVKYQVENGKLLRDGEVVELGTPTPSDVAGVSYKATSQRWGTDIGDFCHIEAFFVDEEVVAFWRWDPLTCKDRILSFRRSNANQVRPR